MPEESYSFATARTRLEEIVSQVRKKDTSLEKSLDLLEEGVRLANQCTELIDHADWEAAGGEETEPAEGGGSEADTAPQDAREGALSAEALNAGEDVEPDSGVSDDATQPTEDTDAD